MGKNETDLPRVDYLAVYSEMLISTNYEKNKALLFLKPGSPRLSCLCVTDLNMTTLLYLVLSRLAPSDVD